MKRLFVGGALGAFAMYFLDPRDGRRRRARTRDKMVHAARVLNDAGKVTARDTAHRAKGMWASTRKLFKHEPVSDEVLIERVRAELGRVVSHPHSVEVGAAGGHVTLAGPILAEEVRPLLRCVRRVDGVRAVSDRLAVYEDSAHVSGLQGGHPRPGSRFELMQDNWSPAARLATGSAGAAMLLASTRARGGLCALLGVSGGALLARAATNRNLMALLGFARASRGIVVQKTINVDAPVEQVFAFWTDYQNFPRFMHNVREVQVQDDRSTWLVTGPAGVPVQWTSKVVRLEPNSVIEWRSVYDSSVKHEGSVRFQPNGNGGTRVTVRMCYLPPAGAFGHAVASMFGADPKAEMDSDLLRMKTMIETGRAPHDAAHPAPRES